MVRGVEWPLTSLKNKQARKYLNYIACEIRWNHWKGRWKKKQRERGKRRVGRKANEAAAKQLGRQGASASTSERSGGVAGTQRCTLQTPGWRSAAPTAITLCPQPWGSAANWVQLWMSATSNFPWWALHLTPRPVSNLLFGSVSIHTPHDAFHRTQQFDRLTQCITFI